MELLNLSTLLEMPLKGLQLIEASAGTGKTYTIANLYLRQLLAGREVPQVLVVTFTNAATDELRGRIRERVREAMEVMLGKETDDEFLGMVRERLQEEGALDLACRQLEQALYSLDEAAIFTIHGFCQKALKQFAFHSGQQFEVELVTDDDDLLLAALQDWWRNRFYSATSEEARAILDLVDSPEALKKLVKPLLGRRGKKLLPEAGNLQQQEKALAAELESLGKEWLADKEGFHELLQHSKGLRRVKDKPYHVDSLARSLPVLDEWFRDGARLPLLPEFEILTTASITKHSKNTTDPALEHTFFKRCNLAWRTYEDTQSRSKSALLAEAAEYASAALLKHKSQYQLLTFDDLLDNLDLALSGSNSEALAESIRKQFPVAMIDEFQDTDAVQYSIFRKLYHRQDDLNLVMIGDPKQAIYSFRGGDIFTYMQAREDVDSASSYTMGTNWRSTPGMINAVNRLFSLRAKDEAFIYGDAIPFVEVGPADKEHAPLVQRGEKVAALDIWHVPSGRNAKGEERPLAKGTAMAQINTAVANEIVRLTRDGAAGLALLGDKPVQPGDIAILVRSHFEADELRAELRLHGINAVSISNESVYETAEAWDLLLLLRAAALCHDREALRRGLASGLLGYEYGKIHSVVTDDKQWEAWANGMMTVREQWQQRGFMAGFQFLLERFQIVTLLASQVNPERRLTDLLQLGELLQQASRLHPGIDLLLSWFERQLGEASEAEESRLRLESDAALVKIVTTHASKGLEYPIVFLPYLWGCRSRNGDELLEFHLHGRACADISLAKSRDHLFLAEKERLAEDVRLAYVALTRARSKVYLVWGLIGQGSGCATPGSAIAWLLHPAQSLEDLEQNFPQAFPVTTEIDRDLGLLAGGSEGDIGVMQMPIDEEWQDLQWQEEAVPEINPREFGGVIATDWRISSFSALTREVHQKRSVPVSAEEAENAYPMHYAAGSHVGLFLHLLMEQLDFQQDVRQQAEALSRELAGRFGLDKVTDHGAIGAWIEEVVEAPLDSNGLKLAAVPGDRRLNELAFDFSTSRLNMADLNRCLQEHAGTAMPAIEAAAFRGMVTGVIDLVFEYQGRYFLADYKSNLLGRRFADYDQESLQQAILERRYDLQYLIYTLALHRYLGTRLPDYDYDRHFGGIYYLFMRGMSLDGKHGRGIFHVRPSRALVTQLDHDLFATGRDS